ncbi:hypothetical protein [Streptomyces sp. A1547]|uniref:hypothetical protein n=1 Tax=Streptomyces sp. A1547 TaxID=2563105 RepID=UPI00109EB97B|nr:hypothetical protein [Streptomyces sp. A1547]THA33735.1 hypothetical protein E6W17_31080 [Streptomyces sp. A1547]
MAENCFPDDVVQLKVEWIRTYNRLSIPPLPPLGELDRHLLRLRRQIRRHPYWREHPWTWPAREALHRAAVTAPGGEPEIVKKVVDGRMVVILPPAGTAQGQDVETEEPLGVAMGRACR